MRFDTAQTRKNFCLYRGIEHRLSNPKLVTILTEPLGFFHRPTHNLVIILTDVSSFAKKSLSKTKVRPVYPHISTLLYTLL